MSTSTVATQIRFRPLSAEDLPRAHELSLALNWPHRLEDWQLMHAVSHGVAAVADGELFGTAFCCPQGDYASIGLVIVDAPYQGQGLGRVLMESTLAAAGTRTPVLVATERGAPLYVSQGFAIYERIFQHQTPSTPRVPAYPLAANETLRTVETADHEQIIALANAASGMNRSAVLTALLEVAQRIIGLERDGCLVGFALLRPFGRGLAIGPVVAQTTDQAKALVTALLSAVEGRYVRLDVTQSSGLSPWLADLGIPQVDSVAQMAKGTPPASSGGVVQMALATQALC